MKNERIVSTTINKMEVLTLLNAKGVVILRSKAPFNAGDDLSEDSQIAQVLLTKKKCERILFFLQQGFNSKEQVCWKDALSSGESQRKWDTEPL